jgi:glycosyltransferase involved in cell wall biosynthesis
MKILIPFKRRDIGGPSSFINKFASGMEARGHTITFEETADYDVVLVIVQAPFLLLWRAKRVGKPIVQRLDGVYYWSVAGWKFPLLNAKAFLVRHLFADYTVYQSNYSKMCVEKFLGKKKSESSKIIYNGIDTNTFSPVGETKVLRDFPEQHIFFTASEFRRTDQILPIISALTLLEKEHPKSFKLVIAGHFVRELKDFEKELLGYPWVQFLGKIDNMLLPQYERGSDLFLFTHLNPACPNNIIEAMSCGLPICGISDGAMPELIRSGEQGILMPTTQSGFWKRRDVSAENLAANIKELLSHQEKFSQKARIRAVEEFSLTSMLNRYDKIFLSLL